jgi:histidine triad (HIT) family protein
MDCLFCKMISGEIPAKIVYNDDQVIVINDINPQAPLHQLIIPRKHIATLNDLEADDTLLVGQLLQTAQQLAKTAGIQTDGYRTVMNCNAGAGQTVFHIHLHLLGGREFKWPPG